MRLRNISARFYQLEVSGARLHIGFAASASAPSNSIRIFFFDTSAYSDAAIYAGSALCADKDHQAKLVELRQRVQP